MESQTLWSSIGWGTPSALGCALAEPERRVVLVTGDGAHQLTMQEIGVMGVTGVSPVVIVLNNGLYGVEALISETGHAYNDLPFVGRKELQIKDICNGTLQDILSFGMKK